jgi:hypothetical protein
MTKARRVLLIGSYFAVAFLGYIASSIISKIDTLPMNVTQSGDVIHAEGSFKKVGGRDMIVPTPNVVRIRCDVHAGACTMDEAHVEGTRGSAYLRLFEPEDYHIISWEGGVLVAQLLNTYGVPPPDHDWTLRISVKDKTVTMTAHGKRLNLLGENVDLSNEWIEEVLR